MKPTTINMGINTLEDIKQAKRLVKSRIKMREQELGERLERLPKETFKAATGLVIPAFINNKITNRSWSLVKDAVGLISPFSTNKFSLWKDVAKQVGLVSLAKMALGMFKKK